MPSTNRMPSPSRAARRPGRRPPCVPAAVRDRAARPEVVEVDRRRHRLRRDPARQVCERVPAAGVDARTIWSIARHRRYAPGTSGRNFHLLKGLYVVVRTVPTHVFQILFI